MTPSLLLNEATEALDRMQQAVGDSSDGQARLTSSYVSLARDLRRQMEVASPSARPAIAKGFENIRRPGDRDEQRPDHSELGR